MQLAAARDAAVLGACGREQLAKTLDRPVEPHAGGRAVPAPARDQVGILLADRFHHLVQRDRRRTAHGAAGRDLVSAQDRRRDVEAARQLARGDADQAGVPAAVVQHDRRQVLRALQGLAGLMQHLLAALPALHVGRLELVDEAAGRAHVASEQRLHRDLGPAHAPRAVEHRTDAVVKIAERAVVEIAPEDRLQRRQAAPLADAVDAGDHDAAVDRAVERHHVGHGRDRREIEIAVDLLRRGPQAVDLLEQDVGDHGPAQLGRRQAAALQMRVDDRVGLDGLAALGRMMVGHHDAQAQFARARQAGVGADAAIDGDDQLGALRGGLVDQLRVEAALLIVGMGHQPVGLGVQTVERQLGQRRRADAVGVVIADHADALVRGDRVRDQLRGAARGAVGRDRQIGHAGRDVLRRGELAAREHPRRERMIAHFLQLRGEVGALLAHDDGLVTHYLNSSFQARRARRIWALVTSGWPAYFSAACRTASWSVRRKGL